MPSSASTSKKTDYSIFGRGMTADRMVKFIVSSLSWFEDSCTKPYRTAQYELLAYQISCWANKHGTNMGGNGASDVLEYLSLDDPAARCNRTHAQWKHLLQELARE